MKILTLTEDNFDQVVADAAAVIRRGGIVVYPTDTAYGLGVDATNREAVQRLYTFKHRTRNTPTHVVVEDIDAAHMLIDTGSLEKLWPGPLTIVGVAKTELPRELLGDGGSLGVRVPDNRFAQALPHATGVPITTPSANYHGDNTPYSLEDIIENFGDANPDVDLVIDGGHLPGGVSTLVQVHDDSVDIIREGVVTKEQILAVLS